MSGRKRYVPPEVRDVQHAPGFPPLKGAAKQMQASRSVQRRMAHQRGEPIPTFDRPEDKP